VTVEVWSPEAEESVLGAMMISPTAIETVQDLLDGSEFYRASHTNIYKAILELHEKGIAVDAVTVAARVEEERVQEIATFYPTINNVKHHAGLVRKKWLARGLIEVGQEAQRLGEAGGSVKKAVAVVEDRFFHLQQSLEGKKDNVFTSKELVDEYREKLLHPLEEGDEVSSPFQALPGLVGGRLYVLAGYRKFGKTILSLQFLRAACEGGARVGFGSAEMTHEDLTERLLTSFGIPYSQVRSGHVFDTDFMDKALEEVASWDFEVIDNSESTADDMRRAQRRGKYDFLIFDHLHEIPVLDPKHKRIEVMESVRKFRTIAKDFKIPVLLLAQLSRGPKHDPFPRPTTDGLMETSFIEQAASQVFMVYRKLNEHKEPTNDAELIVSASRFSPEFSIPLDFRPSQVRFVQGTSNREDAW
jgi:replicative DNA helicase